MIPRVPKWISGALTPFICLFGAFLTSCDGSSPTEPTTAPPGDPTFVAAGVISVPSGVLNTNFMAAASASSDLASTTGRDLVLTVEQLSGSAGTCSTRCPSIDWSSGATTFPNRLTVITAAGARTYFLTQNIGLADSPDDPDPTSTFLELGGSTKLWLSIPMSSSVIPGSSVNLELTMANQGTASVNVNWRLRII